MILYCFASCSANVGQIDHLLSAETEATKGGQLSRSVQSEKGVSVVKMVKQ